MNLLIFLIDLSIELRLNAFATLVCFILFLANSTKKEKSSIGIIYILFY